MPSQTPGCHRRSHDSSTYIKIMTPWPFPAVTLKVTSRFWRSTGAIARLTWVLLTSASTSSRGQLMRTTQHTDRQIRSPTSIRGGRRIPVGLERTLRLRIRRKSGQLECPRYQCDARGRIQQSAQPRVPRCQARCETRANACRESETHDLTSSTQGGDGARGDPRYRHPTVKHNR